MARNRFSPEQIITMLREAGSILDQSNPVAEACPEMGISELGIALIYGASVGGKICR